MGIHNAAVNKADTDRLLDLLTIKYGFNGFYHYTDYSNLCKIASAGALVARSKVQSDFHDSADQSVLTRAPEWIHDQVRLFYFPKTPFLYNIEGIKPKARGTFGEIFNAARPHMPRPVALLFREEIAYKKGIKFLDGSASNLNVPNSDHNPQITTCAGDALKYDWCLIKYRGPVPSYNIPEINVCGRTFDMFDKGKMTDHKNAEILIPDKLPLSDLKEIIFRSEADRKQAVSEFGESKLYRVDNSVFNNKEAYLKDYELSWRKGNGEVNIELFFHTDFRVDRYEHLMKFYSYNNVIREDILDICYRHETVDFSNCRDITRIEYYMDDTLCAAWEANKW